MPKNDVIFFNRAIDTFAEVEQGLDEILFARNEDEMSAAEKAALGVGGVGTAATAGLYLRGRRVMNDWGGPSRGAGLQNRALDARDRIKAGYRALPSDLAAGKEYAQGQYGKLKTAGSAHYAAAMEKLAKAKAGIAKRFAK